MTIDDSRNLNHFQNQFPPSIKKEMNGVSGRDCTLSGFTRPGTTCSNEMNFNMNHDPKAGAIAENVGMQFRALTVLLIPLPLPSSNINE